MELFKNTYTKEYFIQKFESIPEELWCIGHFTSRKDPNCHCVLGHCGVRSHNSRNLNEEAVALANLFTPKGRRFCFMNVFQINDGDSSLGPTPKQRILNKLRSL